MIHLVWPQMPVCTFLAMFAMGFGPPSSQRYTNGETLAVASARMAASSQNFISALS
jgi:hypothetical protein